MSSDLHESRRQSWSRLGSGPLDPHLATPLSLNVNRCLHVELLSWVGIGQCDRDLRDRLIQHRRHPCLAATMLCGIHVCRSRVRTSDSIAFRAARPTLSLFSFTRFSDPLACDTLLKCVYCRSTVRLCLLISRPFWCCSSLLRRLVGRSAAASIILRYWRPSLVRSHSCHSSALSYRSSPCCFMGLPLFFVRTIFFSVYFCYASVVFLAIIHAITILSIHYAEAYIIIIKSIGLNQYGTRVPFN